jgi:hypothetical protein
VLLCALGALVLAVGLSRRRADATGSRRRNKGARGNGGGVAPGRSKARGAGNVKAEEMESMAAWDDDDA